MKKKLRYFKYFTKIDLYDCFYKPVAECLAVELFLPVLLTCICRDRDLNTQPSVREVNALTDCAAAAYIEETTDLA